MPDIFQSLYAHPKLGDQQPRSKSERSTVKLWRWVFGLALVVVLSERAQGQACGLDGRLIEFQGTYCFQGTCANPRSRIRVLGKKVLLYLSNAENTGFSDDGLVFRIGETVDVYSEEFGVLYHNNGKRAAGRSGTATATSLGTDLFLVENFTDTLDNGELFGSSSKWLVRVTSCNSCEFVDFVMVKRYRNTSFGRSSFTPGWCKVLE